MRVRIRLQSGPLVTNKQRKNRHLALAFASLLMPAALMASVLGFWRMAADLRLTAEFFIVNGLFSHWQVWLAMAALLLIGATMLNRYGRGDGQAAS